MCRTDRLLIGTIRAAQLVPSYGLGDSSSHRISSSCPELRRRRHRSRVKVQLQSETHLPYLHLDVWLSLCFLTLIDSYLPAGGAKVSLFLRITALKYRWHESEARILTNHCTDGSLWRQLLTEYNETNDTLWLLLCCNRSFLLIWLMWV